MKTIKILGTGCSGCKALEATVKEVVAEMGLDAEVVKEQDIMNIMQYNVMTLPAVVVDEQVVAKGLMNKIEVKHLLEGLK